MKKYVIVGLGSIGRRHLKNLAALGETGFIAVTRGRCALPTDDLPPYQVESDLTSALKHQPDAVLICNPTALHLPLAKQAVEAGCHVFLEKPISHHAEGVAEFTELVKVKNARVQVGFQFRYHPILRQIRDLINAGKIGTVQSAHVHWGEYLPAWHPWEDYKESYSARADLGGGVVLTLCHPFDYLRMLLGEVESVYGMTSSRSNLQIETEDVAFANLRFQSGALASVYLDYVERPPQHNLLIIGDDGKIAWDNADGAATIYGKQGEVIKELKPDMDFERNTMFMGEMEDFVALVKHGETPNCTLEDGVQALNITLAVKKSASLRQEIVL
ncbi:MAG: Gfo/Idh/MocA family protein [Saprospiraceae bacterium]